MFEFLVFSFFLEISYAFRRNKRKEKILLLEDVVFCYKKSIKKKKRMLFVGYPLIIEIIYSTINKNKLYNF
jgi:hypothetical protein